MRKRFALLLAAGVVLTGGYVAYPDTPSAVQNSPEYKAILPVIEALAKAFNEGDARSVASLWSDNGVYLSHQTGERINGRQAIEKDYATHLKAMKKARIEMAIDALRLVTPEVAALDGTAHVYRPGELPSDSSFTMVLVKKNGRWLIDSVHEVELPTPETNYDQLRELDWMVGEWLDQDDEFDVRTVCEWVANNNFLARRYTVARKDKVELQGTQIVGWDANQKKIRSWFFDSDGSFGEGTWRRDGKRWTIQASGVLPSGKKASATQIISQIDDNKYTWQVIGRDIGGFPQPNIEPVTMARQKAQAPDKGKDKLP